MFRSCKDVQVTKIEAVTKNPVLEVYLCELCEQGPWTNETDRDLHRKKYHKWHITKSLKDETSNMCSICLHHQKDEQTLIEHILEYHLCCTPNATRINREVFICDHCHRLFFNKQLLICHMYYYHIKQPIKMNCPKCCKPISGKSTWFHFSYHGCYTVGTCPICLKICGSSTEMIRHVKTHMGHFFCSICEYETTKESYYTKHMDNHKKIDCQMEGDVSRYFLPKKMYPSLKNRMHHIFKGIPLTKQFSICIMCRELCFSNEQMTQHIYGDHAPEAKVKTKTFFCACGEQFFNNVLLKHHIFKLKGDHRVCDEVTPISQPEDTEQQVVYQVYEISDPLTVGMNEIVISGLSGTSITEVMPEHQLIIQEFEQMES